MTCIVVGCVFVMLGAVLVKAKQQWAYGLLSILFGGLFLFGGFADIEDKRRWANATSVVVPYTVEHSEVTIDRDGREKTYLFVREREKPVTVPRAVWRREGSTISVRQITPERASAPGREELLSEAEARASLSQPSTAPAR